MRLLLRFEDYVQLPQLPNPISPPGDPVDYGFVLIDQKIIPSQCSVTLNSYRNADECRVTIPFGRLPIDPRWLRMAAIQVFMGSLQADEFSDGIGPIYGDSQITLIDETPSIIFDGSATTNEIFRGFVDDWEIVQDGDDAVEITCRDVSAVLIDTEMPTQGLAGIPKQMPTDQVITQILVGEPTAAAVPPDKAEQRPRRLDARRDVRRLQVRLEYVTEQIAKTTVALAKEPLNDALANQLTRLTTKQVGLLEALATSGSVAAEADAIPILAQRYGLPSMRGLSVVNLTGEPLPPIGNVKAATYFDSKGNGKKARSGGGGGKQISYWDFITDICVGVGRICYFRTPVEATPGLLGSLPPAELVIDWPKTYYKQDTAEIPTFMYGFNVDALKIQRSFTGSNIPTGVAVSAIDADTGDSISSRFPPQAIINRPTPDNAGTGDRAEYKTIVLQDRIPAFGGLTAQKVLDDMAESIYEQLSRGEFIVNIETTSLTAFPTGPGGRQLGFGVSLPGSEVVNSETDMLGLRAGDAINVLVAPSEPDPEQPMVTQAGNFTALGLLEKGRRLVEVYQFSPVAAALAATASESDSVQTTFYLREMGIDFDATAGFKFSLEAINFLDARNAVEKQIAGIKAAQDLLATFGPPTV